MVIVWSADHRAEYWDCNLDIWLSDWNGNVWIVPGTENAYEGNYWDADSVQD